ncbi:cytochrome c4 [Candidatus Halobeggiatoa sp. HSG11]|nr:cytochrome c4 [Candidatus Halobeggiatoa sp. HSG11]
MKKLTLAFCILTLGSSVAIASNGDATAGKTKSANCVPCHGVDGNSNVNPVWPKLAGQHEDYLVKQLQDFKSKTRNEPLMAAMVDPLTEQDILNLAAYFSSQAAKTTPVESALVERGERIYRGGNKDDKVPACVACHGINGKGNPMANYPTVGGQNNGYTTKQLNDYKNGVRNPEGTAAIMKDVAAKMSTDDMTAVAAYIQNMQ